MTKERFKDDLILVNACLNIIDVFEELINIKKFFLYFSHDNLAINYNSGAVNAIYNEEISNFHDNASGSPNKYSTPESIIWNWVDKESKLYGLAIVLFEILFLSYPLEGKKMLHNPVLTEKLEREIYAESPIFIFDSMNLTNRPDFKFNINAINLWSCYPQFIRDLFVKAFSIEKLIRVSPRISIEDWRKVFEELFVYCQAHETIPDKVLLAQLKEESQ